MAQGKFDLHSVDFREIFPWLHLFRGLRIALELKKMVLAAAGVVLMMVGWAAVGWFLEERGVPAPGIEPAAAPTASAAPTKGAANEIEGGLETALAAEKPRLLARPAIALPWGAAPAEASDDVYRSPLHGGMSGGWPTSFWLVFEPIRHLVFPVALMFSSTGSTFGGLLLVVWTLLVWGIFGGAITRIAAVQVSRDGKIGPLEALRFAAGRYFNYVSAPVLPFLGVLVIVVLCLLGGLLARVPGLDIVMGAIWILALVAGFVMAIALLGLALGWPLMYAAISAEATESFDALSRSYSYVLGRPWHYGFYAVVALAYGGVLMVLATTVAYALVHLSQYAVSWGGSEALLRQLYAYVPTAGGWRSAFGPLPGESPPSGTTRIAAYLVGFWTTVIFLGLVGFAYSYFWSAATIVYFLLRRDVDETEFDEVYIDEEEEEPFPTVAPALGTGGPGSLATPGGRGIEPPAAAGGPSLPIIDPPR